MAFEFPFNLLPKTAAKASEVMGNFNYIKGILDGGVGLANLAPGIAPKILQWNGGALVGPADNAQMLAGGEQEFELATKSLVLLRVSAMLEVGAFNSVEGPFGEVSANLNVDGASVAVASLAAITWDFGGGPSVWTKAKASVSDEAGMTLAAGSHKLSVTFTHPHHEVNYGVIRSRASAMIVPTA